MLSLVTGCKEDRVIEPLIPTGDRVILLEEFTGKGCTNCPKGSREIDNLLSLYGDNLVAVSIHAGFFADPDFFPLGSFDLRTDEGEQLFDYLGPNFGYPAGIVNRTEFNGFLQHGHTAWAAFIAEDLSQPPRVEFTVSHDYDPTARALSVQVSGRAKEELQGDIRISVMITEDGIIDAQDDSEAGGIVENYEHKHVLRGMATPFDGAHVASTLNQGQNFSGQYDITFPQAWDDMRCNLVVFVSMVGQGSFSVLQAGEQHVR